MDSHDPAKAAYRQQLLAALDTLKDAGVSPGRVAAESIFTTQSATAVLEKIRDGSRHKRLDLNTNLPKEIER